MASTTTSGYSAEARDRAARMVLEHEAEQASRWAAMAPIAAAIERLHAEVLADAPPVGAAGPIDRQ
jgi:hypothetical protein